MLSRKRNRESRSRLRQDGRDRLVHQLNVRNRRRILDNLGHISTRLNTLQHVSTISPPYLDHISTISRQYLDHIYLIYISTIFRPHLDLSDDISIIYRPNLDQISTGSRPDLDHISTVFGWSRFDRFGWISIARIVSRSPRFLDRFSCITDTSIEIERQASHWRLIVVLLCGSYDRSVGRSIVLLRRHCRTPYARCANYRTDHE